MSLFSSRSRKSQARRRKQKAGSLRQSFFEKLEDRSLMAAITGSTGPGGFEPAIGGSSTLALWLDASDLDGNNATDSVTNGTAFTTWYDRSGYGRNATLASGAAPTYVSASAPGNNQPAVNFTSAGNTEVNTAFDFDGLGATYTVFGVARYTGGANNRLISSDSRNWLFAHHGGLEDRYHAEGWIQPTAGSGGTAASTNYSVFSMILGPGIAAGPAADIWNDGTQIANDKTGSSATIYKPGRLSLGRYGAGNSEASNGEISEIVIINRQINEAEQRIIENALSAKYGLTEAAAADIYTGDNAGNGNFDFDGFGIGRLNATNTLLTAGRSGFGIEVGAFADDGDWVTAGHKVVTNSIVNTGLPAGVTQRWNRAWFVDETDANNNIAPTMAFDFSDAGLTMGDYANFKLLKSTDGGLNYSVVTAAPTVVGDRISFAVSAADLSDGVFTLGFNAAPVLSPATGNFLYTIGGAAVNIGGAPSAITVADADSAQLSGATISISGFAVGTDNDVLAATPPGGISSSYNPTTGVLTLSGTASVANYQAALQSVTYSDPSGFVSGTRTIVFTATDAETAVSTPITRTVNVSAGSATWDGNSDADGDGLNWNDPLNWVGNAVPGPNDIAIFANLDVGAVTVNGAITVGGIQFTNTTGNFSLNAGTSLTLNGGGITQSGTQGNTIAVPLTLPASSTMDVSASTTLTISGAITSTGLINKVGAGVVVVSGANSAFTGKWNVTGGVLSVGAEANLGAAPGAVTNDHITLQNGGTLRFTAGLGVTATPTSVNRGITFGTGGGVIDTSAGGTFWGGNLVGGGGMTKVGGADFIIRSAGTQSIGNIVINAGRLFFGNAAAGTLNAAQLGTSAITINSFGTLDFEHTAADATVTNNITLNADGNLASRRSGGTLNLTGVVTLPSSGRVIFNADDAATGTINMINPTAALNLTGDVTYQVGMRGFGAAFEPAGNTTNPGVGGVNINHVIGGTGNVIKSGGGTLAFTNVGANTFTGQVNIQGGNLSVDKDNDLGNAANSIVFSNPRTAGLTTFGNFATPGGDSIINKWFDLKAGATDLSALWTGTFTPAVAGVHTFSTNSDDGSMLFVDFDLDGEFEPGTERIVNNNGSQGSTTVSGNTPALVAGTPYPIAITYFQGTGGAGFEAKWAAGASVAVGSQAIVNPSDPTQAGRWSSIYGANTLEARAYDGTPGSDYLDNTPDGFDDAGVSRSLLNQVPVATGELVTTATFTTARGIVMNAQGGINVSTGTFTANGVISGANFGTGMGADGYNGLNGGINKLGAGELVLGNTANTYFGPTNIRAGVLTVADVANGGVASTLGQSSNASANLWLDGGTLRYTGAAADSTDRGLTLTTAGGTIENNSTAPTSTLTFSSTAPVRMFTLGNSTPMTETPPYVPNIAGHTLTLGGTNNGANVFTPAITDQTNSVPSFAQTNVTKNGAGTWALASNTSNYTGLTLVNAGVLRATQANALGVAGTLAGGTAVASGAALDLNGNFTLANKSISLLGGGIAGTGALTATGTVSVPGTIGISGNATIGAAGGSTLTLDGALPQTTGNTTLTFAGAGNVVVNGAIGRPAAGHFSLSTLTGRIYSATGLAITTAANMNNLTAAVSTPAQAFTAPLTGQMAFVDTNLDAFFGSGVTYSNGTGGANTNFTLVFFGTLNVTTPGVYSFGANPHDDTSAVWIDDDNNGTFETTGTTSDLVFSSGCCSSTAVGARFLNAGSYKVAYAVEDTGGGGSLTGRLTGPTYVTNNSTLLPIVNPTAATTGVNNVTINSTGTVTFTAANNYNGVTTVNGGTLLLSGAAATLGSSDAGTNVEAGGTLAMQGGVTVSNEALRLNGTGAAGQLGALVNVSGNNTIAATSPVTARAVSLGEVRLASLAGVLTVDANVNLNSSKISVDGAGNTTINGVISGAGATIGTPPTAGVSNVFADVPEASGYTLALENNNIPASVNGAANYPYTVDNTAGIVGAFDRIAYYLELQGGAEAPTRRYVYVSMDAFTGNIAQIGIPERANAAEQWAFQMFVSNMNVFSNVPSGTGGGQVIQGTMIGSGNIEIWPSNYSQGNTLPVPNASSNGANDGFDFGDGGFSTADGHGSFQIHNYDVDGNGTGIVGQTLLAYDQWKVANPGLGIGNSPNGAASGYDYTFVNNLTSYNIIRRMSILVREVNPSYRLTDNSLVKLGTGTLTLAGSNTYNGSTTINGGTVSTPNLANGGSPSGIGQSSNAAANLTLNGGALENTGGTNASTDRLLTLGAGGGAINTTGTGTLTFSNTGAVVFTGAGNRTLTLGGTTQGALGGGGEFNGAAGAMNTFNLNLVDPAGADSLALTKAGTGVWVLPVANAYEGGTQVNAGHLAIRNSTSLGASTGAVNVAAGAQLAASAHGLTIANPITLNGTTSYVWGTETLNGALVGDNLGGGGNNTFTGQLTLAATSNISTSWNDKSMTLAGKITGPGGLQQDLYHTGNGPSSSYVTGTIANDYAGGTIINSGILRLGTGAANPSSHVAALGTGLVTVNNGSQLWFWIRTDATVNTIGNNFQLNGGTLHDEDGVHTLTGTITLGAGTNTLSAKWAGKTLTAAGQVTGAGALTVNRANGNGDGGSRVVLSNLTNNYGGGTEHLAGILSVPGVNALGTNYLAVKNGAVFEYTNAGSETTTKTLWLDAGASVFDITNAASTLTWNPGAGNRNQAFTKQGLGGLTMGGDFSGGASVTVNAGKLTLTAANTYTGVTTVNAGTLLVNGSIADGAAATDVTVAAGATLGGSGTIAGVVSVAGGSPGGHVAPGTSPGVLTTGTITWNAGSTFDIELNGLTVGTQYDQLIVNGTVNLGGATLNLTGTHVPLASAQQSFVLIANDGTDAVNGTFAGLAEGAAISFNGGTLYLSYKGGSGNDVVLNSQPFALGTAGADTVLLTVTPTGYTYKLNSDPTVVIVGTTTFNFDGLAADDLLTVQLAAGAVMPNIVYNGGGQDFVSRAPVSLGDVLEVIGTGGETATYVGDGVVNASLDNDGTVAIAGQGTITFTQLEPVDLQSMATANVNFANGPDVVAIADGLNTTATNPALVVSGTSNGVAFESVHLRNNTNVVIHTVTGGSDGADSITVNSGVGAHGNTNVTINTGAGADTVTVAGAITVAGAVNISSQTIAVNALVTAGAASTVTLMASGAITTSGVGVDVSALSLVANAATGVDLDTNVANLTATTSGAGSITIDEANGANVLNVAATNGNATVTTATGDLNVTTASASGTVTLTATAGALIDANAAALNVTATLLDATGATGIDLDTAIAQLTAASTNSAIVIRETNGVALNAVNAGTANVTLTLAAGAITDGNGATLNVTAGLLDATGPGGIDLDTSVTSLTAASSNAAIAIREANGLTVNTVNAGTGNVTLTLAAGAITDGNGVGTLNVTGGLLDATGPGGVDLDTSVASLTAASTNTAIVIREMNGLLVNAVNAGTGDVTLTLAAGAITDGNGASVNVTGGLLNATGPGGIDLDTSVVSLTAASTNTAIAIREANALAVNTVNAGTGDVTLTLAAGALTDNNGTGTLNITAGLLNATGPGGIDLDTDIATLTAVATNATIVVRELNGLAVNTVNAGTGDVTLTLTAGAITDNNGAAVNVTAGLLNATGPAGIDLDTAIAQLTASSTNAAIAIRETNGLAVNTVNAGAGNVTLTLAAGAVTDNNTAGTLNVTAGLLDAIGPGGIDLDTSVTSLTAATTNAAIVIREASAVAVNTVNAGTSTVAIAAGGAITDGNAAANNVTGSSLLVTAVGGIALDTTVGQLAAANATSGAIAITNTGALNITTLSEVSIGSVSGVSNPAGAVTVIALSSLTVSSPVSALGAVVLTASDNAAAGDDLNVNATVTSTGSSVTLNAGDNATISANLSASTTVAINIDAGDADPATGASLNIPTGVVISATSATFTGATQADSFTFAPQATTPINVFGLAPVSNPGGDSMLLDTAAPVTNPTLNILGGQGAGLYTFGNRANVQYSSIENANTTTPIHIALDATATGVDNIRLQRSSGGGTDFEVYNSTTTDLLYAGPIVNVLSFTFLGSANPNTVTIDDVNGLVDLAGTVPAPTGVGNNGNVTGTPEVFLRGNGGTDAIVYANTANNTDQIYGFGTGSAPGSQAGEVYTTNAALSLSVYFDGVESVTSNDATPADTGTLTIVGDANANTISLATSAGGTTVSATGYVPFTFAPQAFNAAVVNAGDNNDSITLVSLSAAESGLALSLNGEIGNDTISVEAASVGNTLSLQGGVGNDAYLLGGAANTVDNILVPITIADTSGTDSLTLNDSADLSGDTVTITDSTIDGVSGAPSPNVTFSAIEALDVTTSGGGDTISTTLNATNGLVTVNVHGAGGDDDFFLSTADNMTTLTTINLIGDAGSDDFGNAMAPIHPLAGTTTNVAVYGDTTAITTNPGGAITDRLFLDMTTTSAGLVTQPLVIVDTVTGQATTANTRLFRFGGIDDIDLYDGGVLTDVAVGDLYLRATDSADNLIFYRENGGVRIKRSGVPVNATPYAPTNRIVAYGRAGNDYMEFNFTLGSTLSADFRGENDNDTLVGGLGNDLLVGGGGSDSLKGGEGNDVLYGEDQFLTTSPIAFDVQRATGLVQPTTLAGGNDTLEGGNGNDFLFGGTGADNLNGGLGDDYLHGGDGNDTLNSAGGNDILRGEAGADLINGDAGNDIILGGAGDDRIFGRGNRDFMLAGSGMDQIQDEEASNDVVVAGGLALDADNAFTNPNQLFGLNDYDLALQAMMFTGPNAWSGAAPFATRVSNLTPLTAIINDTVADIILGNVAGQDYIISNANDQRLNTTGDQLLTV